MATEGRLWWAALAAVAVLAAGAAAGPVEARYLVVPGRSVGPVILGMRVAEVERAFGRPSKVERDDARTAWYTWKDTGRRSLAVEAADGIVILISVARDERYRTRDGIGAGQTAAEVEQILGRPSGVIRLSGFMIMQFQGRGLGVVVDTSPAGANHVTGVVVAASLAGH